MQQTPLVQLLTPSTLSALDEVRNIFREYADGLGVGWASRKFRRTTTTPSRARTTSGRICADLRPSALGLREHRRRVAHFKLAGCLDVE